MPHKRSVTTLGFLRASKNTFMADMLRFRSKQKTSGKICCNLRCSWVGHMMFCLTAGCVHNANNMPVRLMLPYLILSPALQSAELNKRKARVNVRCHS